MRKVSIVHSGELTINAYYLADALKQNNITVDFFLYSPRKTYKRDFQVNLLKKIKNNFPTVEFKGSLVENGLIKVYGLVAKAFRIGAFEIHSNPFLPAKTRKHFKSKTYNYIITIGQASLYWLYKTDPQALKKTIHYTLEIQKLTDPYFITPALAFVIKWETRLLDRVKGLIVQDVFRAEALLNCKIEQSHLKFFFLPVSVNGQKKLKEDKYLHKELDIAEDKNIILYFGAAYGERCLKEISEAFDKELDDRWVLVFHGPHDFSETIRNRPNIKLSNRLLEYDDLHLIISSAKIGLAFYDITWPNTRFTAFSSEKIARYLQSGVPFIAFENESYLKLREEFKCCALINDMSDLSLAIEVIMQDYENFRLNCFKAFDKYYNIRNTIVPLVNYLNNIQYSIKQ